MKVVNISELPATRFSVSDVASFKQTPLYKNLSIDSRKSNGFLLIEKGSCVYSWEDRSIRLYPGALIYLPLGSVHEMRVVEGGLEFTRIDFTLKDADGETIVMSRTPLLIAENTGKFSTDCIESLTKSFSETVDNFKNISLLCSLLSEICTELNLGHSKISPAINYINENYLKPIDPDKLAELCTMSRSQMYRLFKEETGATPVEYRNRLRVEKARLLLVENEYSVGEIALNLGFESIYYFSRVFKKHTGVSPTHYWSDTRRSS